MAQINLTKKIKLQSTVTKNMSSKTKNTTPL